MSYERRVRAVQEEIVANLEAVRPLAPPWVWASGVSALVAFIGMVGGIAMRPLGYGLLSVGQRLCILGAAVLSAGLLGNLVSRGMFPARKVWVPRGRVLAGAVAILPGALACVLQIRAEPHFVPAAAVCLGIGIAFAAMTAPLLWAVLRRGAGMDPTLTAMATGALAGLAGMIALEFHCPNLNLMHVLAGHFGAVLCGLLAGVTLRVVVTNSRVRTT